MNDTTQKLLQNLLQYGAGALVTRGIVTSSQGEVLASAVVAILVYVWAHLHFKSAVNNALDGPPPPAPGRLVRSILFLFLALSFLLFPVGCKSPPGRVAYNVVKAPTVTAQQAVVAWNDYVRNFHPSPAQSAAVRNYYTKWQAADLAALDAARIASDMASSTNGFAAAVAAEASSEQAAQALSDLIALLKSYGVTL